MKFKNLILIALQEPLIELANDTVEKQSEYENNCVYFHFSFIIILYLSWVCFKDYLQIVLLTCF